jgi:hypothetical protein
MIVVRQAAIDEIKVYLVVQRKEELVGYRHTGFQSCAIANDKTLESNQGNGGSP